MAKRSIDELAQSRLHFALHRSKNLYMLKYPVYCFSMSTFAFNACFKQIQSYSYGISVESSFSICP